MIPGLIRTSLDKSEKEWQAERDFEALVVAFAIQKDSKRYAAAIKAGKKKKEEEKKEDNFVNQVIGKAKRL